MVCIDFRVSQKATMVLYLPMDKQDVASPSVCRESLTPKHKGELYQGRQHLKLNNGTEPPSKLGS